MSLRRLWRVGGVTARRTIPLDRSDSTDFAIGSRYSACPSSHVMGVTNSGNQRSDKPGCSQRKKLGPKRKSKCKDRNVIDWIHHDALSAWWEKEAQQHLEERGFGNRQLRAWGDTNSDFRRYHWCLVGNRPEMMPLDCHLFFDLADNNDKNITLTSSRPMGPKDDPCQHGRFGAGTPTHLSHSLRRTWREHPTSERIVQDIQRLDVTFEQIVAHKGCLVAGGQSAEAAKSHSAFTTHRHTM